MTKFSTLNKEEKVEIIKGVIIESIPFIFMTTALWASGILLKIEGRGFWFSIGFLCTFFLPKRK